MLIKSSGVVCSIHYHVRCDSLGSWLRLNIRRVQRIRKIQCGFDGTTTTTLLTIIHHQLLMLTSSPVWLENLVVQVSNKADLLLGDDANASLYDGCSLTLTHLLHLRLNLRFLSYSSKSWWHSFEKLGAVLLFLKLPIFLECLIKLHCEIRNGSNLSLTLGYLQLNDIGIISCTTMSWTD